MPSSSRVRGHNGRAGNRWEKTETDCPNASHPHEKADTQSFQSSESKPSAVEIKGLVRKSDHQLHIASAFNHKT